MLRALLAECAQAAMRDHAKMSDLRIKGLRIAERGGKNAKKRAVIAIVRSLAVTMVALLKHPEREYKPISDENQRMLDRLEAERQSIAA